MMRHEPSKFANNTQGPPEPLSEPHFDDEATLISARRVVPFHKLTERTNSKRYLVFAATLAAALVMGVVGGVIYVRFAETAAPRAETTQPVAQPPLQDEFVSSSAQNDESATAPEEVKSPAIDDGNQKIVDKPRNPSVSTSKRVSLNPVRAERREFRRPRRQAAREKQRSDDLFRIRDIFEGSSRP